MLGCAKSRTKLQPKSRLDRQRLDYIELLESLTFWLAMFHLDQYLARRLISG
jgi:hypothetical protein